MEIKPTELTKNNPGVLIKVQGENMLADDYIALMDRHNRWAADAYKRESERAYEYERLVYMILDKLPFDMLESYMEVRAERMNNEEGEA